MIDTLRYIPVLTAVVCAMSASAKLHADSLDINVIYLEQQRARPPVLSNLVVHPEDEGEQGALLGITDNNTTGKFLKQTYDLETIIVPPQDDVVVAAQAALQGTNLVVLNMPSDKLLEIADLPEASDDLLFNAGSANVQLRSDNCRTNMLHTLPSRAMLTDALMQFFNKRKWDSIYLLEGNRDVDKLYAASVRKSANKFRVSITAEKQWIDDADMRRNASAEIPVFTQARKYDAVVRR